MIRNLVFFSLLAFIMGGCIQQDRSDCTMYGLRLQFKYTYNNSGQDLLVDEVRNIRVYVFDAESGLLVETVELDYGDISRSYIDICMPDGQYTFVAWGSSGDDLTQGGYAMQAITGTTMTDDFCMMLVDIPAPAGKGFTDVVPQNPDFDHLFFAIAEDVTVVARSGQTVEFDFIKNTSTLKVVVTGLEYLTRSGGSRSLQDLPLDVFTTGKNWLYGYDNALDASAARMLYLPYDGSIGTDDMEVYVRQRRLSIAQSASDPVMLYVRHASENNDVIAPMNLVEAIMQNPAYSDQEAIDREDLFVLEISLMLDAGIVVTINGWEVIILDYDLIDK